jgi:hypothetical protein
MKYFSFDIIERKSYFQVHLSIQHIPQCMRVLDPSSGSVRLHKTVWGRTLASKVYTHCNIVYYGYILKHGYETGKKIICDHLYQQSAIK